MSNKLSEPKAPWCFLISEPDGVRFLSREAVKFALNTAVAVGVILGATVATGATASAVADAGNTGNGALTLDASPVLGSAKDGDYRVVFVAADTFTVENPAGKEIGKGKLAVAFVKDVKFTIAAGGTAFAAGDSFTVRVGVEVQDTVYKPWNPAATDGSEVPAAINAYPVEAHATRNPVSTVWEGPGEVREEDITWPAGLSAVDKARAVEYLRRARNIKFR